MLKSKIAAALVSIHLVFLIAISFYWLRGLDIISVIRVNYLSFLFQAFGIISLVQFFASGFKKSQLLRLFVFYQCFKAVAICLNYYLRPILEGMEVKIDVLFFQMATQFIEIIILFTALALLQTSRKPSIVSSKDGNAGLTTFQPVTKSKRLLHLLIDVLFVLYVAYAFLGTIAKMIIIDGYQTVLFIISLLVLFLGIYYFIMELFFKITFAKIITNTIIINKRGQKAGIFQIIGRSFCRFIPFEGVSFLFNDRGWHDRLSGTYVVKDQYSWETEEDTFDTYFTGEPESDTIKTLIP